jgi:hypothetical protein
VKRTFSLRRVLLVTSAVAAVSCGGGGGGNWENQHADPSVKSDIFQIVGTVRFVQLEGGHYVIRLPDGSQFNPINLPDRFKASGMKVQAEVRRRNDILSTAMLGPLVEILRIRSASDESEDEGY